MAMDRFEEYAEIIDCKPFTVYDGEDKDNKCEISFSIFFSWQWD